jgi:hypothetical protein
MFDPLIEVVGDGTPGSSGTSGSRAARINLVADGLLNPTEFLAFTWKA